MSKTNTRATARTAETTQPQQAAAPIERQFIRDYGHTTEIWKDKAGLWRWRLTRDADQQQVCAGAGFASAVDAIDDARPWMPTAADDATSTDPTTPQFEHVDRCTIGTWYDNENGQGWRWRVVQDGHRAEFASGKDCASFAEARAAALAALPDLPTGYPTLGPHTPSTIVAQLWDAAAPNLTREQLQWFARAGGDAFESAQHLCRVMAGVGCLIAEDSADGKVGAGSFQDGADTLQLFTAFSDALDGISSLMYVADAAVADLIWEPAVDAGVARAERVDSPAASAPTDAHAGMEPRHA